MKENHLEIILSAVDIENQHPIKEFLKEIMCSTLFEKFPITLILHQEDPLKDEYLSRGVPVVFCDKELLTEEYSRLSKKNPFGIIHTFSSYDHLCALKWITSQCPTTFIIATRSRGEVIKNTFFNRIAHYKKTDINLILEKKFYEEMKDLDAKMYLQFDQNHNPVILPQAKDEKMAMLSHCYRSLLMPNRLGESQSYAHIKFSYITHFYCDQNNIESVTTLLEKYGNYSEEVRSQVHFVIVDDGSPIKYEIPKYPLNMTWIKINQNISWNQGGARNLGVIYAKSDNILLTDLDCELSQDSMEKLIKRNSCGKRLYKIYRKNLLSGTLHKGHPNLFFMSRGRFFELYGYDEEFAGHYGAEDVRFVKYQKGMGSYQTYLPKSITVSERVIDRNKSYHGLIRDHSFNTPINSRKNKELKIFGKGAGHSRMFLNFTWNILSETYLEPLSRPKIQSRLSRCLSWLQQILPRF